MRHSTRRNVFREDEEKEGGGSPRPQVRTRVQPEFWSKVLKGSETSITFDLRKFDVIRLLSSIRNAAE